MQNKLFVMCRSDGTGARLCGLLNTFFIAKKLGDTNMVKFMWYENFFSGEKTEEKFNNTNMRNFENNTIIGASCEKKEVIFSANFIAKFYLPNLNGGGEIYDKLYKGLVRNFEDLKKDFEQPYNFYRVGLGDYSKLLKLDSQEYRQITTQAFKDIEFTPFIQNIIHKAHSISRDLEDFYVIHLRAGDNIGFWSLSRVGNSNHQRYMGAYFELALAIIEKESTDKNFIIVSDDLTSANELVRVINRKNVFCVDKLRDSDSMSNLELFFFDVILMSNAEILYGGESSLVGLATLINAKLVCYNPYQVFTKEEQYKILLSNYSRLKNLYPALRAFSCAHKFYLAQALNEDIDTQISYCDEALSFDFENDKYRIYKIDCLLKKDINLAEAYIKKILTQNKEFLSIVFDSSSALTYTRYFNEYFKNSSPKYPYISFLAFKFAYSQEKMVESIVYMNNALQANDNFLNELLKPDLTFKEQDINNLALQLEEVIMPKITLIQSNGAKARIQNHLSYKLGNAIIENSKSLFGYIRMFYVLSYIRDKHLREQKLYEEKIKINPNLALPPLESYKDYKEALNEKECFTYKLGQAFMKGYKIWYKGGLIQFYFEAKALEREFKSKKAKQE